MARKRSTSKREPLGSRPRTGAPRRPSVRQREKESQQLRANSVPSSTADTEAVADAAALTYVSGCPIVGIGASAGGLDAFKKFFSAMPADSGMAFVLIPHLDPTHESLMVELLTRQTAMPVVEAQDSTVVEPNRVYIIPPNKYLTISQGILQLSEPPKPRGLQTAIDFFCVRWPQTNMSGRSALCCRARAAMGHRASARSNWLVGW